MATPKTGKPRGRPRKDFLQDPDRFAVALAFALKTIGTSENDAFRAVAALAFGSKVFEEQVPPRRKRGRGAIPGGMLVGYERTAIRGGPVGSLIGRADSLRLKTPQIARDPKAMAWLLQMQAAFALALQAASSAERCATRILELGRLVVEGKLPEANLLNVLSAELPDFSTNVSGQGQA
jgi:hypothetical protein